MPADVWSLLFVIALVLSIPAIAVLLGVAFHVPRSREFLLRHGRVLVAVGFVAWGACLGAQLLVGDSDGRLVGSLLGIALPLGVALGRHSVGRAEGASGGGASGSDASVDVSATRPRA